MIIEEKSPIALVTGSAVKIGRLISLALAQAGYDLIAHYMTSENAIISLSDNIRNIGKNAYPIKADLKTEEGIDRLTEHVIKTTKQLDLMVNNASFFPDPTLPKSNRGILEENYEGWEKSISVNAKAPFFLIKNLAQTMQRSDNPSIINILDTSVLDPYVSRAAHSVSKSALLSVTAIASQSIYPPIRVNSLVLDRVRLDCITEKKSNKEKEIFSTISEQDVINGLLTLISDKTLNGHTLYKLCSSTRLTQSKVTRLLCCI